MSMQLPDFLVEDADGQIHLAGHRIGIQDIVFFYNDGYTPEMLLAEFPTLSLALIHKVIAFYLENRTEIDAYVAQSEAEAEQLRSQATHGPSLVELRNRLQAMQAAQAR